MRNPSCFLYGPGIAKIGDQPVHFWRHGGIQTPLTEPLVMGHEASGTIAAVGSSVTSVQVGDRVAIEPGHPCRRCERCKEGGRYNLCRRVRFAAAPPDAHGLLCKFWKAPEDFVYRVADEEVTLQEMALLEPLAVAVHAARLAQIRPGITVAVTGCGTVGLLCAAVAVRVFGALRAIVLDITGAKVDFARGYLGPQAGAYLLDRAATAEGNAVAVARRLGVGADGVDTVIEASGAESSIQLGIYLVKAGGSYVQTGLGQPKPRVPMLALSEKELRVMGCFRYSAGDFALAANVVERRLVDLKPLISSITPFERATDAWEMTGRGDGIKNLIEGVRD
ncbi:chaperonin 10-like protein [Aspergillus recurvatus]